MLTGSDWQDRVVYKIHGGPMKGRTNFQTCGFQCVRDGELWQCNWLEGNLIPTPEA